MFNDRFEAARQLAAKLKGYKGRDCVVLAIPRGGVQVGYIVARELGCPLDVVFVKKIGFPGSEEYAIGAVGIEGEILNRGVDVSEGYVKSETARIRGVLKERLRLYYGRKKPSDVKGRVAIVVDDGIATGNTMALTVELVRKMGAEKIVVAVPVASQDAVGRLKSVADDVVCIDVPDFFYAIGEFYVNFSQVEDDEAMRLLKGANGWT